MSTPPKKRDASLNPPPKGAHYLGHRQRLREKLLSEPKALADYELLELLLGQVLPRRDTKPLAKELLAAFGSLRGVLTAQPEALAAIKGLRRGARRALGAHLRDLRPAERGPGARAPGVQRAGGGGRGRAGAPGAPARGGILGWRWWTTRTGSWPGSAWAGARWTRRPCTRARCWPWRSSTRPRGSSWPTTTPAATPSPSTADRDLTRRIAQAAQTLGLRVLDHLVVAETKHFSFQEAGLL